MNATAPELSNIGSRLILNLVAVLGVFLLTAVPALADTVRINQVVQTLSTSQGTPNLKLNTLVSQDPAPSKGPTQGGPRTDPATAPSGGKTESIISGVTILAEGQSLGVDITQEGEVEGTICDCGDILIAGGAFPKWPFIFLAGVPFIFIDECTTCDENPASTPTPTPPSNPTPTPEPASLLLFGSSLLVAGAGLRRRYARGKVQEQKSQEGE